jgi:hypothetical protein
LAPRMRLFARSDLGRSAAACRCVIDESGPGAIATLAVGAKAVAKRMAQRPSGYGAILMRGAESAATGGVLAFGVLLLTATWRASAWVYFEI